MKGGKMSGGSPSQPPPAGRGGAKHHYQLSTIHYQLSTMITKHQIKLIHALLSNAHLRSQKESIISGASGGRTTHISQLSPREVRSLVKFLQSAVQNRRNDHEKMDRQRKLMIHFARQMGWEIEDGEGNKKADMERIHNWCIKTGYLHKPLMKYNASELPKLVNQFQKMYLAFLKHI